MRTYEVQVADEALIDVREIASYIAYSLGAPNAAAHFLDDFEAAASGLTTLPERHELVSFEPWRSRGLRHLSIGGYTVFYCVDDRKSAVTITRVLYAGSDFMSRL